MVDSSVGTPRRSAWVAFVAASLAHVSALFLPLPEPPAHAAATPNLVEFFMDGAAVPELVAPTPKPVARTAVKARSAPRAIAVSHELPPATAPKEMEPEAKSDGAEGIGTADAPDLQPLVAESESASHDVAVAEDVSANVVGLGALPASSALGKAPGSLTSVRAGGKVLGQGGLAAPVRLSVRDWRCAWPAEAEYEDLDEQVVEIRVLVASDGKVERAELVSDPGYGFGAAARNCARNVRFTPAADEQGRPTRALSPPIRVRFVR